ncbi:PQQ-binding-like beta-propeller repeat protein [Amycolatopsis nigrescens]|uniref:outer membrane protein assembly factor BamB family protein n=1 Tax=Amycolatopsis nigrescens TaxID=381445 RepID=UPI0004773DD5|nr:PQQ-binding-like beta-propeller repeat protein [Amycolatopsis nigrescens]
MTISRKKLRLAGLVLVALLLTGSTALAGGRGGAWPSWQGDVSGSRHNASEYRINPATVGGLELKWAFAYPKSGKTARSQPAVVDGNAYFGGTDGKFYATDAKTGTTRWTFDLASVAPAPVVVQDGPAVARGKVYFGDNQGYVYALDQRTGKLVWAKRYEEHPDALHTSSPLYHDGRIYIGTSSRETDHADPSYPCCTFRGHLDSLDAETGALMWRYDTMPATKAIGTWPSGVTKYGPAGGGIWGSPVLDKKTGTLYIGTGQNYSGSGGDFDSLLALDARSGAVHWKQQVTHADTWRVVCGKPDNEGYCPGQKDGTDLDYDFSSSPNVFQVNGRTMVGVGQKSGVYHVFDGKTGEVSWRRQLSETQHAAGTGGIQWGTSYDGEKLYVATYYADPGTLFALNPANGDIEWETPSPANGCSWGGAAASPQVCVRAHASAVTTSRGVVYLGGTDGKMRAYSSRTGAVLWEYDAVRNFAGVNGLTGRGGALSGGGGAVVANGMLYIQAGYYPFYPSEYGTVMLAFGLPRG